MELEHPTSRRRRGLRWLAPVSLVVVIIAIGVVIVSTRPDGRRPGAARSTSGSGATGGDRSPSDPNVARAESLWESFPVDANPRPAVLLYPGEEIQPGGFPDSDTKVAFMEGRVDVTGALPSKPATMDGYPVLGAADAVQLIKDEAGPGPIGGPPETVVLHITDMQLLEHTFTTDRGEARLPSWQVTFDGVASPAFVLALPKAQRFAVEALNGASGTGGSVSGDGKSLTVGFVARQEPISPCCAGFASQMFVTQTPQVIVLDVESVTIPYPTASAAAPSDLVCADIGHGVGYPKPPLTPGEADTKTIVLDQPLGNRVVIDQFGNPLPVTPG